MSRTTDLRYYLGFLNFFYLFYSCHSKLVFFFKHFFYLSFLFAVLEFRVPNRYSDVLFVICHFSFHIGYIRLSMGFIG